MHGMRLDKNDQDCQQSNEVHKYANHCCEMKRNKAKLGEVFQGMTGNLHRYVANRIRI